MKVLVTGASGLIGTALTAALSTRGDEVVRLVRRPAQGPHEVQWDPAAEQIDSAALVGVEAVVHLAGAGVGEHRWTPAYKEQILSSRVLGTRTIARALAALPQPPRVLISGSAVGFYGDRGEELLDEFSPRGEGFLADVVHAWEGETQAASAAGIRVVHARTGLVMAPAAGAFGRLLPLIKLGLGGPLGSGKQWWPWITLVDEVRAVEFLIDHEISGPVNLVSPEPLRNGEITKIIAQALNRPSIVPAPGFALRLAVGQFAEDILASQRVLPTALTEAGFTFTHADPSAAAAWLVAQT